ncbi:MAG: hypothetical protein KDD82_08825, partial [Planctomycetes bacterium]|nr:hypothetical protein [Planctomycetota bacterium]
MRQAHADTDSDPETSGHQAVGAELASARRRAHPRRLLPDSDTDTDSDSDSETDADAESDAESETDAESDAESES